jgi:VanZ family protein
MLTSQKLFVFLFTASAILIGWGILRATPPQQLFEESDKVAHFIAFAALSFTGRLAFKQANSYIYWSVMIVLAFSMEYLQGMLQASRYSSIEDAIANAVGVFMVLVVFSFFHSYKNRKLRVS